MASLSQSHAFLPSRKFNAIAPSVGPDKSHHKRPRFVYTPEQQEDFDNREEESDFAMMAEEESTENVGNGRSAYEIADYLQNKIPIDVWKQRFMPRSQKDFLESADDIQKLRGYSKKYSTKL